jgi:hypothetical protein
VPDERPRSTVPSGHHSADRRRDICGEADGRARDRGFPDNKARLVKRDAAASGSNQPAPRAAPPGRSTSARAVGVAISPRPLAVARPAAGAELVLGLGPAFARGMRYNSGPAF